MAIYDIIGKYDDSEIDNIILDYDGYIEEYSSIYDIPEEIQDEEAKATLKNGILKIVV